MWQPANRSPHLHHFRICPMKEAIKLRSSSLNSSFASDNSNDSYSRIPVLSNSTLSLRSCHVSAVCAVILIAINLNININDI